MSHNKPKYKNIIDFSGLERHDEKAKEEQLAREEKEREPFLAEEVLHLMSLSRLIESVRFTIPMDMLDEEVTKDNLKAQLASRIRGGDPSSKDSQLTEATKIDEAVIEQDLAALDDKFDELWASFEDCKRRADEDDFGCTGDELAKVKTFGDFFDYQFPLFPELTDQDRGKLKLLAQQRVAISKQDVAECLGIEATEEALAESQVIQYIFASGSKVIAVEVFKEILQSLSMEPQTVSFAPHYVQNMLGAGRRLATLLPNIIILGLLLALAPLISPAVQHSVFKGVLDAFDDQWGTGCSNGTTNDIGCFFLRRNFYTSKRPHHDALRFTREEAIYRIWNGEPDEKATYFGSTWLIGALVIRHTPAVGDSPDPTKCSGNVSTGATHLEVGKNYGCDALWTIVIPFNSTQTEALALASQATLSTPSSMSTAILFDFTGYQQANGLLVHTRAILSLPFGGGVVPRAEISPIDPRVHEYVLPLLIVQGAAFVMFWLSTLFYLTHGEEGIDFDLMRLNTMMGMIAASYWYLLRVSRFLGDEANEKLLNGSFYTTDYNPRNFDQLAKDFNLGMSLLGFYALFFITFLGRFFRDVPGLELVVTVLRRTYIELLSLGVVFILWTIGYVAASMVLFGPTVLEFSNFTVAVLTLARYFFGQDNYETLSGNSPVLGPIFFFFFQLFVLFFALNLLIAVLTAPLTDIKKESAVENELLDRIESEVIGKKKDATVFDALKFRFYSRVWCPLVIVIFDARPVGSSMWLDVWKAIKVLYPTVDAGRDIGVIERLDASLLLLHKFKNIAPVLFDWWEFSELFQYIVGKQLIKGKVSMALVLGCIVAETPKWYVRDARLLTAAYHYQRWFNRMKEVLDTQETLVEIAESRTSILAGKLDVARECAQETYENTDLDTRLKIARGDLLINKGIPNFLAGKDEDDDEEEDIADDGVMPPSNTNMTPHAAYELEGDEQANGTSTQLPDFSEQESPSVASSKRKKKKKSDSKKKSAETRGRYYFSERLDNKMATSPFLLIYAGVVIAFTIWAIMPFFGSEMNTAFLARSASNAIGLHAPFAGKCDDAGCESALTFELYLDDVGSMGDFENYVNRVLKRQLFDRAEYNLFGGIDGGSNRSVMWDSRVELLPEGLTFRQHRASTGVCVELPEDSFGLTNPAEIARLKEMTDTRCHESTKWSKDDLTPPSTIPAPFSQISYVYQEQCLVSSPNPYLGWKANYPCEGYYVTNITSSEHLDTIISSGWMNDETRLIVITVPLTVRNELIVDYVIIAEFGDRAAEANVWTLAYTRGEVDVLEKTRGPRLVFQVMIVLHFLGFVVLNVRYVILLPKRKKNVQGPKQNLSSSLRGPSTNRSTSGSYRPTSSTPQPQDSAPIEVGNGGQQQLLGNSRVSADDDGDNGEDQEQQEIPKAPPEPPLSLFFILIVVFGIAYPVYSGNDRETVLTVLMIIYTEVVLTESVVFPLASMFSKQVKILLDTLGIAALHCCYVLPFLIIFYMSFSYAGLIIFGRVYIQFSLVRTSILEIVLGTFGRADTEGLQLARPVEAQVFTVIFFCAVLIVLANMFLAMVTSASADAQYTPPGILVSENVQYFHGRFPMFGKFLTAFLATCVKWEEFKQAHPGFRRALPRWMRRRRPKDPVILTPWGRMWFPLECLLPRLRPLQANRVLKQFHHDRLNSVAAGALVPFVLQNYLDFRDSEIVKFSMDEHSAGETASLFSKSVAVDWFVSKCQQDLEKEFEKNVTQRGGGGGEDGEQEPANWSFYPGMRGLEKDGGVAGTPATGRSSNGVDGTRSMSPQPEEEGPVEQAASVPVGQEEEEAHSQTKAKAQARSSTPQELLPTRQPHPQKQAGTGTPATAAGTSKRLPTPQRRNSSHSPSQPLPHQVSDETGETNPAEGGVANSSSFSNTNPNPNSSSHVVVVRPQDAEQISRLDGSDWTFSGNGGLYWSAEQELFFDVESEQFYDPETQMWFDPNDGEDPQWYKMDGSSRQ